MRRSRGFTLTEILVVLVILAVLTGLAVPNYRRSVEQSRFNEAVTTMNIIHMGQKIYRLDNPAYYGGTFNLSSPSDVNTINTDLNIDIAPTFYTTLAFSGVSAGGYTAQINRNSSQGGNTAWSYRIVYTGSGAPAETRNTP